MSRTSIKVYSEMGLFNLPLVVLLCWVFCLLSFIALCEDSVVTVKFLKAPHAFSHLNSATFVFEVLVGGNGACTNSNITCKLDDGIALNCEGRTVLYADLQDGNHTFEVCTNGSQGVGCGSYNWTVDTIPPTAYITTSTPFTNAMNVSINISFSEPCTGPTGGGSFVCSSVNDCNLLVYGSGQVIPSSFNILQPNLQYSVLVGLSSTAQYGRVILVMDKNFCTDSAGNKFTRNQNSTFNVHFDRRSMFVNFTTHVPERLLQLNGETRLVRATNNCIKLRMCLTFPEPVLNSSAEILNSIKVQILYALQLNQGTLLPLAVSKQHPGHRRFEYKAATCISGMAIVTVNINSTLICISGTPVSQVEPITFIYDSLRPAVTLSTPRSESLRPTVMSSTPSHIRTRERNIPMLIKFVKPVFGVNSSIISITGGHIQSFKEISSRIYAVEIKVENDSIYCVSVFVPENVIGDVAGNKNLRSNDLQLCPYHVPKISSVVSVLATASFVVTSIAAGLLTVSIASLSSIGTFSTPFSSFSNPRSACHFQVFALSRWLAVRLPVNYYEFARGLQWSIPYFSLPWETGHIQPVVLGSSPPTNPDSYRSKIHDSGIFLGVQPKQENLSRVASVYKARLRPNPKEYISYFQNNSKPDAEYILDGWEDFSRTMFWLAIIGGSLILLHALLLVILKFRKQQQRGYGLLTFPRFEIFLVNLALPSICEASAALIRGGTPLEFVVGTLLLGTVYFLLLALLWFLSTSITFAKLLQYNEDLQVGRIFNSPRNRGQWTSKIEQNSDSLTILGPLFEDIRGPMLSQKNYGESIDTHGDGIIASNEEIEELCPKDEEVSGDNVERTPGTRLNSAPQSSVQNTSCSTIPSHIPSKRSDTAATLTDSLTFSTSLHTHGDDGIIASNDETEDLCPKDEEVSRDNAARTLDSAPRSLVRSTSSSTKPSHIPSKRSNTATTLVDSLTSSISFHTYGDDGIIASDDETEDLCQKAEEVSRDNVVRTSATRLDSTPRSSMRNMSHSTTPSHIPSKRSDTTATLVDSLTSSIGFHSHGDDGIIASDDKTKDICPKAEEVFQENVVRTPGTMLNSTSQSSVQNTSRSTTPSHIPSKRSNTAATLIDSLTSNTSFHTHGDDGINASNNKTEDLCPKAKEVSGDNVVKTLGTRLDLAPQNLMQSTSDSTRPSHIPSKKSDTTATLIDSLMSSTSFHTHGDDGIIASDDKIEDLCPKAEEVSGDIVVTTLGTRLDSAPRSSMRSTSHSTRPSHISKRSDTTATLVDSLTSSTSLHTHGDDGIIASNGETEDLCPKVEEVSGDNVVRTSRMRLDSTPQSSVQSTSHSTRPSHIPSKRSDTTATLVDSMTSSTSFHTHGDDGIITLDDETEDICPKDEKFFGDNVVRTSGTRLDSAPRSSMQSTSCSTRPSHIPSKRSNTVATLVDSLTSSTSFHTHGDDGIIASNVETGDLCPKAKEVSGDNVVRILGTRLDSATRSSMRSTSHSTSPSHIPLKRSNTIATMVDSLTSNTSFDTHDDDGIIADDDKTEDLCPKAREVSRENVVRTSEMRLDSTPRSLMQSTSRSTRPSHIPSNRSDTVATLADSLTSSTSFHTHGNNGIIASNVETEDLSPKAEEAFRENVLRTLGTRLDLAPQSSVQSTSHSSRPSNIPSKRSNTATTLVDSFTPSTSFLALGDDGFIAFDGETRDLCPKAEEVFGDNVVRTSRMRLDSTPPSLARSMSHSTQLSRIPSTRSRTATTLVDSLTSKTSVNTHGDDGIIAIDGETEELFRKVEKVSGGSVVKTLETRFASAPPSSARSTSRSTQPSHIPFTRSHTAPTLAGSLTSGSSVHPHGDDGIIASDDKTEEVYPKAEDLEVFGGIVHTNSEAPFNQKLFGKLRLYYTLLESLRRVVLGTMTGVYKDHWPSEIPTIILLCITSFQLLFLILNKPFINKEVQLVEIISVSSEVCVFAVCLVLLESPSAAQDETIVGVFMLIIFLLGFLPQILNQWYALQRQIKQLDSKKKCFLTGLKIVSIGLALLFISPDFLESEFPGIFGDGDQGPEEVNVNIDDEGKEETNDTGDQAKEETNDNDDKGEEETNRRNSRSSNRRNSKRRNRNENSGSKNSGTTVPEKSWLNQLRELVKAVTNCMGLPKII